MEASPGLREIPVQPGGLGRHGTGVGAVYAVQKGYKRFFDLVFHSGPRTNPNATAAVVKRDCNPPAEVPACLN